MSDEARIKQILINLLSNAFKYTLQGKIQVKIDKKEILLPQKFEKKISIKKNTQTVLNISVIDTGVGIPLHIQEYLFK